MPRVKYLGRHMMIRGEYVEEIINGRKTATIRKGIVKPKYREVILHGGGAPIAKIQIERVYYKKIRELTDSDAFKDGFRSRDELIRELKRVYPDLGENDWVTIIEFRLIQRLDNIIEIDTYMGLEPVDIARISLRYLANELSVDDKRILFELTRTRSIRATAIKLFNDINKRYVVRKVLRRVLNELVNRGILKKSVRNDVLDSQMH